MTRNLWHMYAIDKPATDGIYLVRLVKKYDLLSTPIETLMEYIDGEWDLKVPMFINEYRVEAWKKR